MCLWEKRWDGVRAKLGWFGTHTRMVIALAVQSSKQKPDKGSILATNLDITVFFVM